MNSGQATAWKIKRIAVYIQRFPLRHLHNISIHLRKFNVFKYHQLKESEKIIPDDIMFETSNPKFVRFA